jgi:integrase
MGLGPFPTVTLAAARQDVLEVRRLLHRGEDPLALRRAERAKAHIELPSETFQAFAEAYISEHSPGWKHSGKSAAQWRSSLANYAYPRIGTKPVRDINTEDVLAILRPIWVEKNATATRVRGRIEAILDAAKVRKLRDDENPARWKGHLAVLLPSPSRIRKVKHHSALKPAALPEVMRTLASRSSMASLALRFVALTACRVSEAVQATWGEIDLHERIWIIPAARTKTQRVHRVPLSREAVAVLQKAATLRRDGVGLVFPGQRHGRALSLTSLMKEWRRSGGGETTVHGLRSTFRDWCSEQGEDSRLAELALAHVVGSETERAYARSDLLDQRMRLMRRWASFACGGGYTTPR